MLSLVGKAASNYKRTGTGGMILEHLLKRNGMASSST